ncbi:MBL fold metallo-hydrolase [Streptococcus didelphis]|uniref:MBL fold metallo-hydrolase n=1 Tax=Streptococcus didelphis TaxID=102886 RepID=A0ABY9LHU5_9STRE|nr:MBL fold metallo-hydrolase [Streptococcus didelphis]WMB28419.1 MBL fold metallo-hydrolase [Streptococcus didelphis]WMB29094.1 MBL fold metallo-hydrolase [Streptococcus didelphis]
MNIFRILNALASENTYILENKKSLLVIDPGSDGKRIIAKIKELAKPVSAILLTHAHYDHIMSLDLVRKKFKFPPVYISGKEASWLFSPKDNLSGLIRHADIPDLIAKPAEKLLEFDKNYTIGDFQFVAVETPGHSIGGVSFIFNQEELIFSGDALFRESIGRSDLPTGNHSLLLASIKEKLFTLPNHFEVYPGHGPKTTISHEKNFNMFLK